MTSVVPLLFRSVNGLPPSIAQEFADIEKLLQEIHSDVKPDGWTENDFNALARHLNELKVLLGKNNLQDPEKVIDPYYFVHYPTLEDEHTYRTARLRTEYDCYEFLNRLEDANYDLNQIKVYTATTVISAERFLEDY